MKLLGIRSAVIWGLVVLALLAAEPAFAQSVIAFRDDCTGRLYAMRGDGSERIALPLPSLPEPTDRYISLTVLDVSTSGPTTVIYYAAIIRTVIVNGKPTSMIVDHGLFAVQVNDNGALTTEPMVPLSLPAVAGVDPNSAYRGAFSPTGSGDRLALVASNENASVLMTARVERDAGLRIIGLSDLVAVGDLYTVGIPDPTVPTEKGFTGFIDYSPDGRSIVASIYYDLWLIHLGDDHTYLSAERLTESTSGFGEWNPAFSPDGSHVAFVAGAIDRKTGGVSSRSLEIYSLATATHSIQPVTTNSNKGNAASMRNNPIWSPDSAWLGFTAYDNSPPPRRSMCSALVNSEIYLIRADGSTIATPLTNTNGTSVEAWPKWGW